MKLFARTLTALLAVLGTASLLADDAAYRRIGDLYPERSDRSGQQVTLRGEVVKAGSTRTGLVRSITVLVPLAPGRHLYGQEVDYWRPTHGRIILHETLFGLTALR